MSDEPVTRPDTPTAQQTGEASGRAAEKAAATAAPTERPPAPPAAPAPAPAAPAPAAPVITTADRRRAIVARAISELSDVRVDQAAIWREVFDRPGGWTSRQYDQFCQNAHWCGAWVLRIYQAEGYLHGVRWIHRVGFADRKLRQLAPAQRPQPGDLAYFRAYNHHAIVEAVDGLELHTVDANQTGDTIRRVRRRLAQAACFYSAPV